MRRWPRHQRIPCFVRWTYTGHELIRLARSYDDLLIRSVLSRGGKRSWPVGRDGGKAVVPREFGQEGEVQASEGRG